MTAYTKHYNVDSSGQVLNEWALEVYKQIKVVYVLLGGTGHVRLVQGAYSNAVGASAGTHTGSGVFDLMPSVETQKNYGILQKAARMCMTAAWHRTPSQGPWGDHVHCVVIGDSHAASLARAQVVDYYAHRSGLAGHVADKTWHPSVLFSPLFHLHNVNFDRVRREAKKSSGRVPLTGVIRVQRALNKKLGTNLTVNGLFNAKTKAAYAHWETIVGGDGDGIPGVYSLTLLGAGRFNVVK
jgi:hypothetical protein